MGNIKQINIKNRILFFFNEISILKLSPDLLKIGTNSYKNIHMYYIGYITINSISHLRVLIV